MKMRNLPTKFLFAIALLATSVVVTSCIGDQSVAKKRGVVKDFSVSSNAEGCGESFLNYVSPYDTCTSICTTATATEAGYHLASLEELSEVKKTLVEEGNTTLLTVVNGSANLCIPDVVKEERPSGDISIKSDFCSCINGKPDILSTCSSFCAAKAVSDQPILYVNTIIGSQIALNSKLGNLYNWCTVQLENDDTTPQCTVTATDGTNTIVLPINVTAGSNSFNVNILSLAKNRTWLLKLVESKTGSNAESSTFQIKRVDQEEDTVPTTGVLKAMALNQYTCMTYGGTVDSVGNIIRTTFARIFYYYPSNDTPAPIPPAGGTNQSKVLCHDEVLYNTSTDSADFPRLELVPSALYMWDPSDTRFVALAANGGIPTINKIIQTRLQNEYGQSATTIDLFKLLSYPNRPTTDTSVSTSVPLGYIMIPFSDATTGKTYCPTTTHYNSGQPLFTIMKDYMHDTEGLFLAEKEAETVQDGSGYKTIYGTMFARESTIKNYGFYIQNGLRIRADANTMNSQTINFYWPVIPTADPTLAAGRKMFTVRAPSRLNGNKPTGQQTTETTTDKRIGCIPVTGT